MSDLERYLAPQPSPSGGDPLVDDLRRRQRQDAALALVRDGNPDKAGRANELARVFNVPADTIERNLPQFEAADHQRQAVEMMQAYPAIGKWAAEPRHAAVGRDDIPHLARISRAFHVYDQQRAARVAASSAMFRARFGDLTAPAAPAPTFGNFFRGIGSDFVQQINEIRSGARLAFGDLVGDMFSPARRPGVPFVPDYGRQHEEQAYGVAEATIRENQPAFKSDIMRGVYSGVSSLAQILPATAASILTGNPAPVLAYAGLSTSAPAYAKYRTRGATARQAALGASGEGSVEVLTELLPMKFVVGRFGKAGFGEFVAGLLGRELPSEQIATHVQDAIDASIANPNMTLGQYLKGRPSAFTQTLVATLTQSLLLGGPSHLVHHLSRQEEADQAGANGALLDEIGSVAQDSKTRTRDPEAFRRFIEEHSAGSPVENIYIPGEKLRELQQSASMDDQGFFGAYASQIVEAAATGGDIVIPLSEAAAHLSGTPAWDAIKADARLTPGGMSLNEAKSFEDAKANEMKAMSETMAAQMEAEQAATEPRQKIAENVRDKLMHAGFRPDVANAYAELWAARYATRAQRLGRELTGAEGGALEVRQVLPENLARAIQPTAPETKPDAGLLEVINIMKRKVGERSDTAKHGPSLLDWIASKGGIEDRGGDLKSMGVANIKGFSRKGERKLIRPHKTGQASMLGADGQENSNTPDELALRAWEAGYFPEFPERPTVNDLLEAIGEGVAGRHRYASNEAHPDDQLRAAAQELYQILDRQGLDPETATPQEIKRAVEQYQAEVMEGRGYDQGLFDEPAQPERTMTEQQRSELEARQKQSKARRGGQVGLGDQSGGLFSSERDQSSLFQSYMEGPRGRITFVTSGKSLIELFEARDLSTFIHESGHHFLEELKADAEASPEAAADWETVKAWFKSNGAPIADDGTIPTEAHELWARGFERFAMEGKAPSSALRRAFDAFRSWLLTIYKVVDNLRSPVSDEVRSVMERLIATDEEIASAKEEQNIKALFTTAEQAGMTEAEFGAYRQATSEARDEAYDALLYRTMAAIRQQKTKDWKEEAAGVRSEVTKAIDNQPVFRALRLLTSGNEAGEKMKLDRAWLIDLFGADALSQLPRRVPPIHSDKGTTHADTIAEMSGFESGDEMVRTLIGLQQQTAELKGRGEKRSVRQIQIDEATQTEMLARHGDILNNGLIEDEARALIHSDKQGEVIASEIRALARRANKRPTPYAIAREWAKNKIAGSTVAESLSGSALQRYERAARNAAKEAEKAMLEGDVNVTYRQKQIQMLNNALISEAKKAKDAVEAAAARLGKLAKRKTIGSIDQDYLDQVHGLLEQVEFRPRSQRDIDRQTTFEAWAKTQEAAGHDVVVPPSFAASLGSTHWTRLTVEQMLGLDDTVKQIVHLGRLKQKLIDGQEERDFEAVVGEALMAAANLPPKPPSDLMEPSFGDRMKAKVAGFDAGLLKMETVVDWLDNKHSEGVFNRIVFKPIAEAQARAGDMFADHMKRLNEALAKVPKETLRRWGDRVTAPELLNAETGNPYIFTRQQLISMALNMGNEGNAQRLADGYRWQEPNVLQALDRELTAPEWRYVQDVWDIIGGLWPEIEAMERRVNGVAPEKVASRPLETKAGTLRGGYFPAVYDSTRDYTAERNEGKAGDLFETIYTRATTRASATKERAEQVKRPILLSLGVISRHLGEVIHDIAHREAVMNADKFLSDRRIMQAVDATLGPAIRKQFRPWLKFVANQWAMERAGNEGIGKFINKLRTNATVVGMGFRISTMMQQIAGYSNSFEVVGTKWVSAAVAQTSRNPIETFNFVMARSGEVRHRMDTLDRDIDAGIKRLAGAGGHLTDVKRFAFHGIGYMDRIVVIPTWIGAYNKALAGGMEEDAAIYEGDKAVRQSQGAGAAKDLAAVARGTGQWGQAFKLMTMFYSYMSAVYQRQRTLGRDVRAARSGDIPGLLARAWWLVVVPPVLAELMGGRGPGEDEDWGWWALKLMTFQALGAIPFVREIPHPVWDGISGGRPFDFQLSPLQRAGQSIVDVSKDLGRKIQGEETKHATKDTLEAAGYWTGLVPGQVATATQFLVDVGNGDQDPDGVAQWYRGLTTGKAEAKR